MANGNGVSRGDRNRNARLARLRELQVLVGGGDEAQTRRFVEEQRTLWGKVIKAASVPQQ